MEINSNEKLYTQKDLSLGSGISTSFLYHAKLQRCVAWVTSERLIDIVGLYE